MGYNFLDSELVVNGVEEIVENLTFQKLDNEVETNVVPVHSMFRTVSNENCNISDNLMPIESTVITDESSEPKSENCSLNEDTCSETTNNENSSSYEALRRENETLKSQLKKYIGAVQLLDKKTDNNEPNDVVKQYERKLIQVAEMHAELMEFNEYLQQQINFKDAVIHRLKSQINSQFSNYDESVHVRGEVFISIPSAFLSGNGAKQHHVYQIHIRAGNHEWNIFRRYAHFYALHQQLKKIDSKVGDFKFPPKKTIGNKVSYHLPSSFWFITDFKIMGFLG